MDGVEYEQEVRAVMGRGRACPVRALGRYFIVDAGLTPPRVPGYIGEGATEALAWQSAYETLKDAKQ